METEQCSKTLAFKLDAVSNLEESIQKKNYLKPTTQILKVCYPKKFDLQHAVKQIGIAQMTKFLFPF
jgi:hypothetical protein